MSINTIERTFKYDSLILEDPNPEWTPEEVKNHYANVYSELTQATVEGPETNEDRIEYKFVKMFGTKGITLEEILEGKEIINQKEIRTDRNRKIMIMLERAMSGDDEGFILPPPEAQGMI